MSEQDFNPTPEKPILFSTEMVRAIMNGTKIQTRRIYKGKIVKNHCDLMRGLHESAMVGHDKNGAVIQEKYPMHPGTLLWVRETFTETIDNVFLYRASEELDGWTQDWKWRPSIFMPKHAARIWLMVTDVRIERLQDMGDDDAIAEGVEEIRLKEYHIRWKDYADPTGELFTEPIDSFRSLWQSINAKRGYGWQKNPWVWVYTFEVLSTTGKPETWPGKQLNVVEEAAKYRHP